MVIRRQADKLAVPDAADPDDELGVPRLNSAQLLMALAHFIFLWLGLLIY